MKVDVRDMTGRERIVLTVKQLFDIVADGDVSVTKSWAYHTFECDIACPDVIEVEEVLGE